MRRIASHYIYWQRWHRMHYLELDANGCLVGVFPLDQEIANTEFYDGTLILMPVDFPFIINDFIPAQWMSEADRIVPGTQVAVYRLTGFTPSASEFGTDNGGSNCHIQRL